MATSPKVVPQQDWRAIRVHVTEICSLFCSEEPFRAVIRQFARVVHSCNRLETKMKLHKEEREKEEKKQDRMKGKKGRGRKEGRKKGRGKKSCVVVSINLGWKKQFLLHIIGSAQVLAGTLLGAQPWISACCLLLMPHSSASLEGWNNTGTNSPIPKVCTKELRNSSLAPQMMNRSPDAQTFKAFQESAGRISRDISASFSACRHSKSGIWCWKRLRSIASLLSIVGQHCLFLAEAMQRGPLSNRLRRPSKETGCSQRFASSFAEFIVQATTAALVAALARRLPSLAQWECSLPGRGGNSLNFNHTLDASAKARKILVYMIRNKMCYIHIVLSAISAWA